MSQDALNPIFDYAANGQHLEKEGEWRRAIDWYHKALSCLPNLYGSDKKIKQLSSDQKTVFPFSKHHAARIYASLGRCLMNMGRSADSLLASRAAYQLDRSNILALECMRTNLDTLRAIKESSADVLQKSKLRKDDNQLVLRDYITLIVVTHCARGLVKFQALSPPTTKLLTATYGSLVDIFGDEIRTCHRLLCYDHHSNGSCDEDSYLNAVELYARQNGFDLHVFEHVGLFAILDNILSHVKTPYILFVEHDWLFQGNSIQLSAILNDMDQDDDMHSVRFNKRENHLDGLDFIMEVDTRKGAYPLLRTSSHSNNPNVMRTDKLRDHWLPICGQALQRVVCDLGGSAFGIEEILFKRHVEDIRKYGFNEAHKLWGTYVFGKVGDSPRVVHLGE